MASGGETKEKENEPKKDQESISTTTATEKKKKGKQVKPKPLDIDIVGKRNQGRGEKARPRNGRNKDKEEKQEENTVKETVKEKATSTTAAAAPVTQQQQQQPTQQREAKPKKANRGSNGSGRGSNGRNKQNTTQQQPSSYPVDVTQQPWYPPYQAQVEQPQMTQMEPNHIILDDEALKKALVLQIEYYFSDANLQKDMWLRKKLEPKTGCLPLQTISSFKRVSELTMQHADKLAFIKSALAGSKLVEVVELNNQHYLRTITQPTKWVIGEGESVPPDSILPASASSVELHQNAPVVKKPVKTQQQQQEQKKNEQKEVDKEKWNPDAQVFVPSFLKTKTPEPGQEAKQEVDESDDDSDEDKRWIEVKKPPKSVTPTTLNRPVKDGELLIEKEASSASAQAGTDLFAVASKPRPNSVSESDHREELDFELDGERDDSDHGGQVAYDTEDSDDDSMIPDEELPNVVLITKTPEQKPKTVKAQLNDRTGVWENRTRAKAPKCGHFSVSGPFSCATTSTRKCMASSARRRWLTPRLVIATASNVCSGFTRMDSKRNSAPKFTKTSKATHWPIIATGSSTGSRSSGPFCGTVVVGIRAFSPSCDKRSLSSKLSMTSEYYRPKNDCSSDVNV